MAGSEETQIEVREEDEDGWPVWVEYGGGPWSRVWFGWRSTGWIMDNEHEGSVEV